MDERQQTKANIVQWAVPTIIFLIMMGILLFNFSMTTRRNTLQAVEETLLSYSDKYSLKVQNEFVKMSEIAKMQNKMLTKYEESESEEVAQDVIGTIVDRTPITDVLYIGENGEVIMRASESSIDSVERFSYYSEIAEAVSSEIDTKYIYLEDNEINGEESILIIVPNDDSVRQRTMLLYYPVSRLSSVIRTDDFDSPVIYFFMDSSGIIMESIGKPCSYSSLENLWKDVSYDDASEANKGYSRMRSRLSDSVKTSYGGESRTIAFSPVGINDWYVSLGVSSIYAKYLEDRESETAHSMVVSLLLSMVLFSLVLIGLGIFNMIKNGEKRKELEIKADTDLLTGLNNKIATERKIKQYIANNPDGHGMLFILDIDNFKKINDTLGHAFGDEVLASLGKQIGSEFRASDIIGRTGGDEFTIFLKNINDDKIINREAQKVCYFFKNFQVGEYVKYSATASIGVAIYGRDGKDFESLYKAADEALYLSKKRGKNQLAFYGETKPGAKKWNPDTDELDY